MRLHRKSHTGCVQCKKRKVKRDEELPACGTCVRRQQRCSFLEVTQPSGSPRCFACGELGLSNITTVTERSLQARLEISLAHFFLTESLPTIVESSPRQETWQRLIFPSDAWAQSVSLDAHLVTAAMHKIAIAHETTLENARHREYVVEKQSSVLRTFVYMLSHPTPEEARTLFALSALVTIWSFASNYLDPHLDICSQMPFRTPPPAHEYFPEQSRLADLISIMKTSRGIGAVVNQCRPWLNEQGLGCMLKSPDIPTQSLGMEACNAIDKVLVSILNENPDMDQLSVYTAAINRTKKKLKGLCRENNQHVVVGWPVGLPQSFMDAVSDHDPPALIITAYWSLCIFVTPHWWAQGWGTGVISEIDAYLPRSWRHHLEWPLALMASVSPGRKSPTTW